MRPAVKEWTALRVEVFDQNGNSFITREADENTEININTETKLVQVVNYKNDTFELLYSPTIIIKGKFKTEETNGTE